MELSWSLLEELEKRFGDSFYIADLLAFQENYDEFLGAFRRSYPNTNIAYSYKTNYAPRICQLVNSYGGFAEVVSGMEYDLAIRVGVPPERIIFNGPYKQETELEKALLSGSIVNLDSLYEMAIVENIAHRSSEFEFTVGIRCNFELDAEGISRFGFDVEGKDFKRVVEQINTLDNCRLGGLHCHFSTSNRSVESYERRTRRMLELSKDLFGTAYPQFINLGGGFFGKMSSDLERQFGCHVPNYQEYAEAIAPQIAEAFPDSPSPELILEPGTAIVSNTMIFVAKVIEVKTIRSKTIAVTSGSIHNTKPTLNKKNLPVHVIGNGSNLKRTTGSRTVDFVGYTCMEIDYLSTGYEGSVVPGDYVIFENVGAYTIVLKPPFISPSPAVISHDPITKEFQVIKRNESFSDIFSTYVF